MARYSLMQMLKTLADQKGSDMHISSGVPPKARINGKLISLDVPPLTPQESKELCYSILTEGQRKTLETTKELDFAFTIENLARFRGNIFFQRGCVGGAFRLINSKTPTIDDLGLPPVIRDICGLPRGLVLVTGATGSGKSTTLAAMVDYINSTRHEHILTIEDPVEYVHNSKMCLVNQREIGSDSTSFATALKSALRQDPDVILVGELRDLETVSCAITAAETGHLVLGTLHTNSCISTLSRILDVFPSHQKDQVRTQLGMALEAVLSQVLIPSTRGGRVLGLEVLRRTPAISALIVDGKFKQIYSYMQSGQGETGMQTLNQCLQGLTEKRLITKEMALAKSNDIDELKNMLGITSDAMAKKPGINNAKPAA